VPERDILLNALVAEVLGPRRGAWEHLPHEEDPLEEYITGVLAPCDATTRELDAEDEPAAAEEPEADDQPADPGVPSANLGLTVPALDPRSRPASLGLSFSLRSDGPPRADICSTWARYEMEGDGWKRSPRIARWDALKCTVGDQILIPPSDAEVEVVVRTRPQDGSWRVSIFLVNATPCAADEHPRADKHVFQPQIRVRCAEGAEIVPTDDLPSADDPEDASLAFLHRRQRSLARGHLCSAVWRDLDPERAVHESGRGEETSPFIWVDGEALLSSEERAHFSPADLRTEYVPMVPVPAPDRDWHVPAPGPELHPDRLSELWDGAELDRALRPLLTAYGNWIQERVTEADRLRDDERSLADVQVASAREALRRMSAGLDLLRDNENARLAFCFANRAMAMQSRWAHGTAIAWYPFQLAFQLLNLPAVANPVHPDRLVCDLLWFPTGGGKTEAYLGLAAFALAHRRLIGESHGAGVLRGAGTTVLSRYTLRLLTIQQFRRALALITAAEVLRVTTAEGRRGWRPEDCAVDTDHVWGRARFSIGLWVGGNVSPNGLQDIEYMDRFQHLQRIPGAISLLEGTYAGDSEPAQVITCPACSAVLALPPVSPTGEAITLHLLFGDVTRTTEPDSATLSTDSFQVQTVTLTPEPNPGYQTLSIDFTPQNDVAPPHVDAWIEDHVRPQLGRHAWRVAARGSRPGYLIREAPWGRRAPLRDRPIDFEIYCPNPRCDLNGVDGWSEETPTGPWPVPEQFRSSGGQSRRCPIPAYTVDEQVYQRCPSIVIATVDKFARLAFEQRAASLFGNVERYNEHLGYYRQWCPPSGPPPLPQRALQECLVGSNVPVRRFAPPDLILQDELHLIEGPLGSMVGLYETAIETLATTRTDDDAIRQPKYIASTATVRRARDQVRSLFQRELQVFPPPGLTADDSFFARLTTAHPVESTRPGRLHVGICAPGRGAQTPTVRIWSRLLQHVSERLGGGASSAELDRFWTLVGYFNAIRELASAVALFRQDIVQRISTISGSPRQVEETEPLELSSRADSLSLPGMLDQLAVSLGGPRQAINAVVATSMFGTGVDVDRLGLMVVHGQPKTTSSYIQATGRVGRSGGGLVVTFYRAARPRDLNHFEFFAAYHAAMFRHVEPVTVNPFSPRARDRTLGPVAVAVLRQAFEIAVPAGATVAVDSRWRMQQRLRASGAWASRVGEMANARNDPEVIAIPRIFEQRAQDQPGLRRPAPAEVEDHASSELDRWQQLAVRVRNRLLYHESTLVNPPSRPVVLGDLAHHIAGTGEAYEDAPNSLREVEATTTYRGWR
jgi:Helicase conserved C-terminal domain